MANDFTSHFHFGSSDSASPIDPESPFRVLVIGTFAPQSTTSLAETRPRRIDIDNFDTVLGKLQPSIRIPMGDHSDDFAEVTISEWDDFHPDQLFDRLPLFQRLRSLRSRLQDDASFEEAAGEVQGLIQSPDSDPPTPAQADPSVQQPSSQQTIRTESDSDLLERVLGKSVAQTERPSADRALSAVDRLVQQVIAPYIEPKSDPRKHEYIDALDQAIAQHMRMLLHDPAFQSLESNWIGLKQLVDQCTGSGDVQVFVVNTDRQQLDAADSSAWVGLKNHESWSLILSTETFDQSTDGIQLLSTMGQIAASCNAPLIACASPNVLGRESWQDGDLHQPSGDATDSDAGDYESLRRDPVAKSITLIGPRYLSRMPYGQATDPIDSFGFEEIVDPTQDHDSFLWGPSSLLAGTLIAESFLENGWTLSADDRLQCDDLPAFTFKLDDEPQLMPCAEMFLSERNAEAILSAGVIPLLSIKHRNAARVFRFQSIHQPATPLTFS